jgi:hypothetical protein
MMNEMTWWERQTSLIPVSWFGYILLFGWQWRLEQQTPDRLLAFNYIPLPASVLLFLLATVVHYLLYRWRAADDGWLWAMWCSLFYAGIIVSMILWRISMTAYV